LRAFDEKNRGFFTGGANESWCCFVKNGRIGEDRKLLVAL